MRNKKTNEVFIVLNINSNSAMTQSVIYSDKTNGIFCEEFTPRKWAQYCLINKIKE